jgi:hypothetical protein
VILVLAVDMVLKKISIDNAEFKLFLSQKKKDETIFLFCQTDQYKRILYLIFQIPNPVVLITHNSDFVINEVPSSPANLIKWFSSNLNVVHDKMEQIPIGVERRRFFPQQMKQDVIKTHRNQQIKPENALYLNYNPRTNLKKRTKLAEFFSVFPWATVDLNANGADYTRYVQNIRKHHYVLSPDGNGIDCHRTWEALYLNRIPILEKSTHHVQFYSDMPVLLVDSFYDITLQLLHDEYKTPKYRHPSPKMLCSYYYKKIRGDHSSKPDFKNAMSASDLS